MKLSDRTYDIIKWLALVLIPALTTLWLTLGKVWAFPYPYCSHSDCFAKQWWCESHFCFPEGFNIIDDELRIYVRNVHTQAANFRHYADILYVKG